MYGIIAEDKSDIECLKVLIKRLKNNNSLSIKGMGYGGCARMLIKGANQLNIYHKAGVTHFVICYDKDRATKKNRYNEVVDRVVKPSGIHKSNNKICILIPTEEMEAWILADIEAVTKIIPSWKPSERFSSPELVESPKEKLEKLSRIKSSKPLYVHATHNQQVFEHIDLETVKSKCPSFAELYKFVKNDTANYPKNNE